MVVLPRYSYIEEIKQAFNIGDLSIIYIFLWKTLGLGYTAVLKICSKDNRTIIHLIFIRGKKTAHIHTNLLKTKQI